MTKLYEHMKTLGDETRYKIVKSLLQKDFCVGALAKNLNLSESAVSQHLKRLRTVGLVKGEKKGYFTHYSVNRALIKKIAEEIDALAKLERVDLKCTKSCNKNHPCD